MEMKTEDYVLTFEVPAPDVPGKYIFFTALPDGRSIAVFADGLTYDTRGVTAWLGKERGVEDLVTVPKESPWSLVKRDLFEHRTREAVRQEQLEAYNAEFDLALALKKKQKEAGAQEESASGLADYPGIYL